MAAPSSTDGKSKGSHKETASLRLVQVSWREQVGQGRKESAQ